MEINSTDGANCGFNLTTPDAASVGAAAMSDPGRAGGFANRGDYPDSASGIALSMA